MELTDLQKKSVADWVKEGCGLADVQRRLTGELGVTGTYMEVRLLLIEMGLQVKETKKRQSPVEDTLAGPMHEPQERGAKGLAGAAQQGGSGHGVSVSVDRVTVPGSVVSGSVVFSDGTRATWFVDQMGRLALNPSKPGYSPSQADIQAFQTELKNALAKFGY